ncbi:MAG TPA: OmpA family protein [Pseudolabrys sp.]|jgi:outer membrane protein OmpA-like peptidoglycan-associated protein|nr:OmpA family protein [Pseudolabrys sp.]
MTPMKSLLLVTSALLATTMLQSPARSAPTSALTVAQNAPFIHPPGENAEQKNKKERPRHERGPAAQKPATESPSHRKPAQAEHANPPASRQRPHPAQAAPTPRNAPAAKHAEPAPKREQKPEPKSTERPAATPQIAPSNQAGPERHERRRGENRREERERRRSTEPNRGPREAAPAPQTKPAAPQPAQNNAAPQRPQQPAENKPQPQQPKQPAQNNAAPQAPANSVRIIPPSAAPQQPVKPQDAREFIQQRNGRPERTIQDVRRERRTTREDGRVFIHEGDRTIVRENNRTFIRHNEDQRFAIGARDVRTNRRGDEVQTVIVRPNGIRIINVTRDGRLVRRVRRDRNGREIVIIDNRHFGPREDIFVDLPPPRIRIPRDRYIVEVDRASPAIIYDTLVAPPVVPIEQDYTLAQVRYSESLRERMPRLDLDIHFDTGSWQITPDQMDKLAAVAQALNRAIDNNPREVYLIEGHTDAVGSQEDNLSLSDRRAEAVAVALTEQFHVPPENLVTQGYGEQGLKVQTQGASRANRRVAILRITPLIDRSARR